MPVKGASVIKAIIILVELYQEVLLYLTKLSESLQPQHADTTLFRDFIQPQIGQHTEQLSVAAGYHQPMRVNH